ncbi:unnamed protein product [Lepeophtheirus salmonis]|uniref:(salmon louse) hypothetical protein n=1 Tax=Lepeophtheirus salmonis TaxID=72036 RepID=A0A7R8GYX5_LEPSM|nr:unnamed protein product [Lepeophtheirus salmonis]CAF2754394.1 unnamed protein product [Lepeophtheirus salmonis]
MPSRGYHKAHCAKVCLACWKKALLRPLSEEQSERANHSPKVNCNCYIGEIGMSYKKTLDSLVPLGRPKTLPRFSRSDLNATKRSSDILTTMSTKGKSLLVNAALTDLIPSCSGNIVLPNVSGRPSHVQMGGSLLQANSSQISAQTFLSTQDFANLLGSHTLQVAKCLRKDLGRIFVKLNLQRILTEGLVKCQEFFHMREMEFRKEQKDRSTELVKRLVPICKDVKELHSIPCQYSKHPCYVCEAANPFKIPGFQGLLVVSKSWRRSSRREILFSLKPKTSITASMDLALIFPLTL